MRALTVASWPSLAATGEQLTLGDHRSSTAAESSVHPLLDRMGDVELLVADHSHLATGSHRG